MKRWLWLLLLAPVLALAQSTGGNSYIPGGGSLPSQTGNSGKFLTTDGTNQSWASPTGSASSITPGTTTVVGATAPCFIENTATTVMGCTALGTFATQNYATPPAIGGTTPAAGAFTTLSSTGVLSNTQAGAASAAAVSVTGAPYMGGTGTTTFPLVYLNDGTGPTTFSTGGTEFGVNAPTGFTGNFLDFHVNGAASVASLSYTGALTVSSCTGCGTNTINTAAQYAVPYYSAAGTANTLSGLASPTSGAGYYVLRFDPTSTAAVALTADQVGAVTRSISGATSTDTVLYSDVLGLVIHDKAGSAAVTQTLPTPTSLTNTKFAYSYCNESAQADTITPTTWTISLNNGTAGASISVPSGACVQVNVDPFNASRWDAVSYGLPTALLTPVSAGGSGVSFTPVCNAGMATTVNTYTATGNLTINLPTGCADGQGVKLRIKFTASVTYTWNAGFHAGTTTGITSLPTASSSASGEDYMQFDDDTANSRFNYLAIASF